MKGLKQHTHKDRDSIIRIMIPLIQKKFKDNLVALAACCSFARNQDVEYSDLELTAFVKDMPENKPKSGLAKIYDGMLIELAWMTRETYIKTTLDVQEYWPYSGSDTLIPLINDDFIRELNAYRATDLKQKCLDQAVRCFTEYYEASCKVLNAVVKENREGIPVVFSDMISQILRLLSFLNCEPYLTASKMFTQARNFAVRPNSLDGLLDIAVAGNYGDLNILQNAVTTIYTEFEKLFEELQLPLYDDNLDPDRLVHRMRQAL